jgi:hypothetical protein
MKTQKKNNRNLHLQTRNNRWKWMAGATAATAAGVTTSHASLITINLANNYINFGANHLNPDLTGDGHPDLTMANVYAGPSSIFPALVNVSLNGIRAGLSFYESGGHYIYRMGLGSRGATYVRIRTFTHSMTRHYGTPSLMGSIPVFFKDLHINGGAPTRGLLEVTVGTGVGIQLDSLTYNTSGPGSRLATIPDGGSGLALLAMGAGGMLAFRRWRATQERS